jgi:hypothetical protein
MKFTQQNDRKLTIEMTFEEADVLLARLRVANATLINATKDEPSGIARESQRSASKALYDVYAGLFTAREC